MSNHLRKNWPKWRERRQEKALMLKERRRTRSADEQLALIDQRRGESRRERARLEASRD